MATVLQAYPQAKWHQYDPVSRDGARSAAQQAAGEAAEAIYHFDKADVVLSLDADFLGGGPARSRYQSDFADRRRVTEEHKTMNRLYAVESTPSLTGAKADHRLPMRASERRRLRPAGRGSARRGSAGAAGTDNGAWVAAVAKDLQAHRGTSLVVAGDYQPAAVHALAHAMNQALGNVGATVTYGAAIEAAPQDQAASLTTLSAAMAAGQVELLVILGGNPVFTRAGRSEVRRPARQGPARHLPRAVRRRDRLPLSLDRPRGAPARVLGRCPRLRRHGHDDPAAHRAALRGPLGARSARRGRRPAGSRTAGNGEGLLDASVRRPELEVPRTGRPAVPVRRRLLEPRAPRRLHPRHSLADGGPATPFVAAPTAGAAAAATAAAATAATPAGAPTAPGAPAAASPAPAPAAAPSQPAPASPPVPTSTPAAASGLEIIFRPDPTVWDGRFANNGWLQELPKPLTKVTWDTTAWMHPALADEHGLARRRRRSSCAIAATPRACRSSVSPAIRASRSPSSSATAGGWLDASATPRGSPNSSTRSTSARPTRRGSAPASRSPRPVIAT